jgi:hypothetical protein
MSTRRLTVRVFHIWSINILSTPTTKTNSWIKSSTKSAFAVLSITNLISLEWMSIIRLFFVSTGCVGTLNSLCANESLLRRSNRPSCYVQCRVSIVSSISPLVCTGSCPPTRLEPSLSLWNAADAASQDPSKITHISHHQMPVDPPRARIVHYV